MTTLQTTIRLDRPDEPAQFVTDTPNKLFNLLADCQKKGNGIGDFSPVNEAGLLTGVIVLFVAPSPRELGRVKVQFRCFIWESLIENHSRWYGYFPLSEPMAAAEFSPLTFIARLGVQAKIAGGNVPTLAAVPRGGKSIAGYDGVMMAPARQPKDIPADTPQPSPEIASASSPTHAPPPSQTPITKPRPKWYDKCKILTDTELLKIEYPPVNHIIEGLLPEGFTGFAGMPKSGKSILICSLAVEISQGGKGLAKIPVQPGRVLYLSLEDPGRRVQGRLRKFLAGRKPSGQIHIAEEWATVNEGGIDALDAFMRKYPDTRLIIIDTLFRFTPPVATRNGSVYGQDYNALAPLHEFCKRHPKLAVLGIDHVRKAIDDDPFNMFSGSNGKTATFDTMWVAKRDRPNNTVTLFVQGRDLPYNEIVLHLNPQTLVMELWEEVSEDPDYAAKQAILTTCREEEGKPFTARSLTKELKALNITVSIEKCRHLAADLAAEGKLKSDRDPLNAKFWIGHLVETQEIPFAEAVRPANDPAVIPQSEWVVRIQKLNEGPYSPADPGEFWPTFCDVYAELLPDWEEFNLEGEDGQILTDTMFHLTFNTAVGKWDEVLTLLPETANWILTKKPHYAHEQVTGWLLDWVEQLLKEMKGRNVNV